MRIHTCMHSSRMIDACMHACMLVVDCFFYQNHFEDIIEQRFCKVDRWFSRRKSNQQCVDSGWSTWIARDLESIDLLTSGLLSDRDGVGLWASERTNESGKKNECGWSKLLNWGFNILRLPEPKRRCAGYLSWSNMQSFVDCLYYCLLNVSLLLNNLTIFDRSVWLSSGLLLKKTLAVFNSWCRCIRLYNWEDQTQIVVCECVLKHVGFRVKLFGTYLISWFGNLTPSLNKTLMLRAGMVGSPWTLHDHSETLSQSVSWLAS